MDMYTDRIQIVQSESTQLRQYLHTLPPEAWQQPSACMQWHVQDVVAHLTGVADFYTDTISRGLQGDTEPTQGFPPAGTVNAAVMAEPIAQMALATREQPADQVLAAFEAAITHLNDLLAGVDSQDWEHPCYHPWRLMPAGQFLAMTLQELVLHGWDIRSRLAPAAPLSPESFPALLELIATSRTSGFLSWAFCPGTRLSVPIRYRFMVTGIVPSRVDIVVEGDQAYIAEAGYPPASATFHCDTETYVLVMYGRLSLDAAIAMGRMTVAGDQAAVTAYGQWFKGA